MTCVNDVLKEGGLNFGGALAALKMGGRVARSGWNGKGMWLVLVSGKANAGVNWELNTNIEARFDSPVMLAPWIGMKTADGCFVPWLASQTDLLAEDWATV